MAVTWLLDGMGIVPARDVDYAVTVREFLIHGQDLSTLARTAHKRGKLPSFWRDAVCAWDVVRAQLTLTPPTTPWQILAMPLHGNPEVHDCGGPVCTPPECTHVRHLWHTREWRPLRPEELGVTGVALSHLWSCLPTLWVRSPADAPQWAAQDWAVATATFGYSLVPNGALVQVLQIHGVSAFCTFYAMVPAHGWLSAGMAMVSLSSLQPATVEPLRRANDGLGAVVWLCGLTHETYASARDRLAVPQLHACSAMRYATMRRLLRTTSVVPDAAQRMRRAASLPLTAKLPALMLNLRSAPLPAGLRNFSLDLACGVLPTGLGIKFVDEKTCLYCHAVKDTAWHFVDECVYLRPLRQWYADVWTAMSWPLPLPSFGRFLVYGYAPRVGDYTAALALHGALLAAAQYARYTLTGSHLPAASARIVARAQERLMYHLRLDRRFAVDGSAEAGGTLIRPHTAHAFSARWGSLCWATHGRLAFHQLLM